MHMMNMNNPIIFIITTVIAGIILKIFDYFFKRKMNEYELSKSTVHSVKTSKFKYALELEFILTSILPLILIILFTFVWQFDIIIYNYPIHVNVLLTIIYFFYTFASYIITYIQYIKLNSSILHDIVIAIGEIANNELQFAKDFHNLQNEIHALKSDFHKLEDRIKLLENKTDTNT
jgi:hypothetical protein